jgi:valyl-tRNA synthetase
MSAQEKAEAVDKLKKEIERLAKDIETKKARLADETFTSKAPAKVVEDFKTTLDSREAEHQKLVERLRQLQ